jgi:hypothetical protein
MPRSITLAAATAIILSLHLAAPRLYAAEQRVEGTLADLLLTDVAGTVHRPMEEKGVLAVALVFITPDCPIANFYQPTLRKLGDEFVTRGVPLYLVHSDPDVTTEDAERHIAKFKIELPVVLDHDQSIARRVGATVTPEAFIVELTGKTLYQGRIDNFYEALGRKRRAATEHDFHDALAAVADGKAVATPLTKALGCKIPYSAIDQRSPVSK